MLVTRTPSSHWGKMTADWLCKELIREDFTTTVIPKSSLFLIHTPRHIICPLNSIETEMGH